MAFRTYTTSIYQCSDLLHRPKRSWILDLQKRDLLESNTSHTRCISTLKLKKLKHFEAMLKVF